jgi:hypothetical protein
MLHQSIVAMIVMRPNCGVYCLNVRIQVHIALAEAQSGLAEALADCLAQHQQPGFTTPDNATSTPQQPCIIDGATAADGSWQGVASKSSSTKTWQEAATAALSACDAALQIDQNHVKAHVAKAEIHALYAKLFECSKTSSLETNRTQEDNDVCRSHWEASLQCYEKVFSQPKKLGSCGERCAIRYNCACALAMVGRQHEAMGLLQMIAQKHPEGLAGADTDVQLSSLWSSQEFRTLLSVHETHVSSE